MQLYGCKYKPKRKCLKVAAKRITSALVCALLLLFCFSGCSGGLASDNNILQAPRPDGEVSKIQAALKKGVCYKLHS